VARGEEVPEVAMVSAPTGTATARPAGLFGRLFPPAPPLPGKGDPLRGFTYTGRLRNLASGAWLLFRHPLPWGAAGAGWALLQFVVLDLAAMDPEARQSFVSLTLTLAQYALFIGAGWVGWWRPWLFGAAAGVSGSVILGVIVGLRAFQHGDGIASVPLAIVITLTTWGLLFGLIGAFAGFYGGYLRRRMANPVQAKGKRR
jgi:hypothetical protein